MVAGNSGMEKTKIMKINSASEVILQFNPSSSLHYLFLSVAVNSVSGAHRAPSPRKLYKNSPRLSDGEQNTENLQLSLRPNAALSPPTQILFNLFCLMKALAVKNRCGFFFFPIGVELCDKAVSFYRAAK